MVNCPSCGTNNNKNSKFCQNCGSSLVVQSNVVIKRENDGEKKALVLESREERFRKAKQVALKAVKEQEAVQKELNASVFHIGEKIL